MEVLEHFGVDWRLFLAQIVNFLVIAYVFKRFLYKPILSTIKRRQELIEKGLKDAEKAGRALENAQEEQDKIVESASREAEKIILEAKKQSDELREELFQKTNSDIERLMNETRNQIELEKVEFMKESRATALEIARSVLNEAVKNMFDKKEQAEIVKKGIKNLK